MRRPVVLISAPGAVGKSTLALHLGAQHATALWDLSRISLGDNTFIGTLATDFGALALGNILDGLKRGKVLFVFDAFDEAEILSGWDRVENFVREIWQYVGTAEYVAAIFLARTETAALLSALLDELGSSESHTLLEIDYFDEVSAKRFVEVQLAKVHGSELHEQHREPFARALQSVFEVLSSTLGCDAADPWSTPLCRSFLGYAPVLQAIAAHLADYDNYHAVVAEFESASAIGSQAGILPALMASLARREQGKFVAPLRERAIAQGVAAPDWNSLYAEREQLVRTFFFVSQLDDATAVDESIPARLGEAYAEGLRAFLPNHPFLRGRDFAGPAFRDYVYATLLNDPEIGFFVEAWLEENVFVPTPLFADFYYLACGGLGLGSHAGFLYESAVARFDLQHSLLSTLVSPENGNGIHSFVIAAGDNTDVSDVLRIKLQVNSEAPLTFRQRLRSAVLNVRGPVVFASGSQFEVADVEANVQELDFRTPLLSVRSYKGGQDVSLQSETQPSQSAQLRLEVKGDAELRVKWPGAHRHPWASYFSDALFEEERDRHGAMLALRRILIWFRKDRKEDLAKFREFIDNIVIGHSAVRKRMLEFLLKKGILREDGKLYALSSDDAQRFGLNWASLRSTVPTPAVLPLLDEFLQETGE